MKHEQGNDETPASQVTGISKDVGVGLDGTMHNEAFPYSTSTLPVTEDVLKSSKQWLAQSDQSQYRPLPEIPGTGRICQEI